MQKLIALLAASAGLVTLLGAAPAHAQNFDTFVSGDGDDGNGCISPLDACREIGAAISKTDAFGVVHVLPGAYVGITVDKTLDIIAEGGSATVRSSVAVPGGGNTGILVDGDVVVRIRGLEVHTANGGIALRGSDGTLYVEDCVLVTDAGASDYGIDFRPSGASELYVSDTVIAASGNGALGGGIQISPTSSGSAKVVLDNTRVENNATGILVNGGATSGAISMSICDSVISGNFSRGIGVFEATSGGPSTVVLERTTVSNNGAQGIFASRALASVRVRQSAITGNTVGVASANGGQIISHGDNVLAGNTTNGAFTATVPPQ